MAEKPKLVELFLREKRIAVAGVSRTGDVAANAVFKKLKGCGYEVFPVNPNTDEVEGVECYPGIASVPGDLGGVVIATRSDVSAAIVRQCAERGIKNVWFHRSFGDGSVSQDALDECTRLGIDPIVGGCPLMFCDPVDIAHKCMKWWLQRSGKVPK
jgi:predicted CoA-binding protein